MKKTEKGIVYNYTSGKIYKQLLLFSVPFMISNLLQQLYSIVDMIVVGQKLGSAGLSAVSTASQAVNFMTMFGVGFATGGQVYISQQIGAGREKELNRTISTLTALLGVIAAVMTVIGTCFGKNIISVLNTPPESYPMAVGYLFICSGGILFTYGYNAVSAIIRGMGNSKQPCIYMIIAALTNLVLDVVFVICWDWGTAGAALATIIGQAVSLLYALSYFVRNRKYFGMESKEKVLAIDKETAKALIKLGIPFSIRSAVVNVSMMFVTSMVNGVSVAASAVFGVGLKVDDVVSKVTLGFNYSVSTMVGQNFGAREYKRVRHTVYWAWIYCAVIYTAFILLYISNVEVLFGLFTDDSTVLELAPLFVSAIIWSFPASAIMRGSNGFVQGIGNSKLSLCFALFDGFVLRIGFSYLFGVVLHMGLWGFFFGYGLATYGTAIPGCIYFLSNVWKRRGLAMAETK